MKILIVHRDTTLVEKVRALLERHGYQVIAFDRVVDPVSLFSFVAPDLALVEIENIHVDEIDTIISAADKSRTLMTGVTSSVQHASVLDAAHRGISVLVIDQKNLQNLIRHVHALEKTRTEGLARPKIYSVATPVPRAKTKHSNVGTVRFDEKLNSFFAHDREVVMTRTETQILKTLLKNPNAVVTREELIRVSGLDTGLRVRNVDVHIFSIRKKLGPSGLRIRAVRSLGYAFIDEQTLSSPAV